MKRLQQLPLWIALAAALVFCFSVTYAHGGSKPDAGKTVTLTGCLAKGDSPDEFSITGQDGKRYELRSAGAPLADHVGHTVTVKGTEVKAAPAQDAQQKAQPSGTETATLQVTDLQMVDTSCK